MKLYPKKALEELRQEIDLKRVLNALNYERQGELTAPHG
jgi:hypothetical protein